ncbi:MAG: DNA repair protein RecN [Sphingobacteriaceae bacterium]
MLIRLTIQNYALIDNLDIDFNARLNILTGETGAGKSIILGALSLILGQRADSRYFFNQQKKCVIEGSFSINQFHLKRFFEDNNLDYEAETVLRREIAADGKSRSFINDTPVNLTTIKQLGEKLIDIHSQHATMEINDPDFQLMTIDALADHQSVLENYHTQYRYYRKLMTDLDRLIIAGNQAKADQDYFQFQFDELELANLIAGEQEQLEQDLYALTNAETIKASLISAGNLFNHGEQAALIQLKDALLVLAGLEKFQPHIHELSQRLESSIIEIKDIANELENLEQHTTTSTLRSSDINDRLTIFYNLQKKHRVAANEDLIELEGQLSQKLLQISSVDVEISDLQKQVGVLKLELQKTAKIISGNRQKAVPVFEKEVNSLLRELGMNDAALKAENNIAEESAFDKNGIDRIRLLFSANKGHALAEMSKVASGGELSRLMLSIKSIVARNTALPTIIFDEIDTGISGEVAHKAGQIMEKLAENLQVITITHLPQIASKGKTHFFVYKEHGKDVTYTRIRLLNENERISEIAKMLSGDKTGESALLNAKDLLNN